MSSLAQNAFVAELTSPAYKGIPVTFMANFVVCFSHQFIFAEGLFSFSLTDMTVNYIEPSVTKCGKINNKGNKALFQ